MIFTQIHILLRAVFYCSKQVALVKTLLAAHDILLEDLRRMSKGINQAIDLTGNITKSLHSTSPAHVKSIDGEASLQLSDSPQVSAEVLNSGNVNASLSVPSSRCFRLIARVILFSFFQQKADHYIKYLTAQSFQPPSWDDMLNSFQSVGNQLLYLWNTFLKFHRCVQIYYWSNYTFKQLYHVGNRRGPRGAYGRFFNKLML